MEPEIKTKRKYTKRIKIPEPEAPTPQITAELKKLNEPEVNAPPATGLDQLITGVSGEKVKLLDVISKEHTWESSGRNKRTIITHEGVKRIADWAGVEKNPKYIVLTQPDAHNNYQYTIMCEICRDKECVTEIGEANRSNLGSRGRAYPASMATKRAYDRAVFKLVGITGLLSEEELTDKDNEEENMEELSHDDKKFIAPAINQLLLATSVSDLKTFNSNMAETKGKYSEVQLGYLRKLYQKRAGELTKTF